MGYEKTSVVEDSALEGLACPSVPRRTLLTRFWLTPSVLARGFWGTPARFRPVVSSTRPAWSDV